MNDLRELLGDTVASPPPDHLDVSTLVTAGRRRVRRRRLRLAGAATAACAALASVSFAVLDEDPPDFASAGVPLPDAPTVRLSDAAPAQEGRDYRVLTSHTNDNLNRDNGQYFDGMTDDGLLLFRDGPRSDQLFPRYALLDPATGAKDWLPTPDVGQTQLWPLDLAADRLVLLALDGGMGATASPEVHVLDREEGTWSTVAWPGLPEIDRPSGVTLGPDDRVYVPVPATQGQVPEGGWPVQADGDAEDAGADGDTYRLWSASLSDPNDARDERLTVGAVDFTDTTMVWTDATNGAAGRVHVRDLATGEEHSFDPEAGERCNLLSFGATEEHVVMGQYCGTYEDGVRDDRVQVLDTDGRQVVTVQGSGIDGGLGSSRGAGLVTVTSYQSASPGTFVYDLASERFLRISEDVSSWATGGPTAEGHFLYNTPVNFGRGMEMHLAALTD